MIRTLMFAGLCLLCLSVQAQLMSETLISYEFATGQLDTLAPVPIDTVTDKAQTVSFKGTLGTVTEVLPTELDTTNLYPNADLLRLEKAATRLDVNQYPLRTHVKIMGFIDGDTVEACSGTLVGNQWVLTHYLCFFNPIDGWVFDSLKVFPAFDNGIPQSSLGEALVKKAYRFLDADTRAQQDVGLMELETPLGQEVGYMGLYFEADSTFYNERLFHKLCYVTEPLPWDSTFLYTNDTLLYTHGLLRFPFSSSIDLGVSGARGLEGQLGSPFFFQDSVQANHAFVIGGANFASGYQHFRITRNTFFPLAELIENTLMSVPPLDPSEEWNFTVFPSPIAEKATIRLDPFVEPLRLRLLTLQGQTLRKWEKVTALELTLDRENLPAGVYVLEVRAGERRLGIRKIQFE